MDSLLCEMAWELPRNHELEQHSYIYYANDALRERKVVQNYMMFLHLDNFSCVA